MRELRSDTANRNTRTIQGKFLILAALSIVLTLALTFATLELPRIVNSLLAAYFPDVRTEVARGVRQPHVAMVEALMNYARPAGYVFLGILIVLVIVGFVTKRRSLSLLGTFAFFMPVFGYFGIDVHTSRHRNSAVYVVAVLGCFSGDSEPGGHSIPSLSHTRLPLHGHPRRPDSVFFERLSSVSGHHCWSHGILLGHIHVALRKA